MADRGVQRSVLVRSIAVLVIASSMTFGCKREQKFESVCQLIRRDVVVEDENGPALIDIELEWDPCPGDQFQVVRGGREFAACMAKYELGALVPVHVVQRWDTRGYYEWDLSLVGDCEHEIDWEAEGSYEKSQACIDDKSYRWTSGFKCRRRPDAKLLAVCPWTLRN